MVQASNDVSRLDCAYDSLGNCTMRKQDCLAAFYTYDGVGNCLSIAYPGGRVVTYSYDALNEVSSVSSGGGGLPPSILAQYLYEGPGRPGRISRANNINTRILWNGLVSPANVAGDFGWRQIARINHATAGGGPVIDQRLVAYDRNQNKNLRAQTAPFVQGQKGLTNIWSYNPLNELDHAINTKGTGTAGFTDYDLDGQGNRIAITNNGVPGLYTRLATMPPADFQVDQYTVTPFGNQLYDDNGNLTQLTSAASQTVYTYDYADRLAAIYDLTTGQNLAEATRCAPTPRPSPTTKRSA